MIKVPTKRITPAAGQQKAAATPDSGSSWKGAKSELRVILTAGSCLSKGSPSAPVVQDSSRCIRSALALPCDRSCFTDVSNRDQIFRIESGKERVEFA